jgi:predicted Zn finger-like uncharacterized protein
MSMITTCPSCQTTFNVTTEHLNAHQGDVRCGRCGHVFNAFDSLASRRAEALRPAVAAPAEDEPAPETSPPEMPATLELPPQQAPVAEEWDTFFPEILVEEPLHEAMTYEPERAAAATPEPAAPVESVFHDTLMPDLSAAVEPEAPSSLAAWGWFSGIAMLALLLAAQSVFFYRTEIAANYLGVGVYLHQACDVLQCTIPLPRNADLLKIEASDLEADPAQAKLVALSTILSNRAKFRQAYPALELTLTNAADDAVARRIFQPSEYLKPGTEIEAGMAPLSEVSVKLDLDMGDLNAAGYRLYVFYP